METSKETDWFVIYTYPNSEKKIYNELSKNEIEAYLPTYSITRQWSDRKRKLDVPLFRNYLFIRIDSRFRWKVLSINGVVKFLETNKKLATITNKEINIIKKVIECKYNCVTIGEYDKSIIGETVVIENGLMGGVEGKIIDINNKKKILIELPTINQTILIDLTINDIRIVNKSFD